MSFMLGNESVAQIEKRLGIPFPDEIREFMEASRQENASNIGPGQWHCFDVPFVLVCGDMATAEKIYYSVKDRSHEVKEKLQFSIANG